MFFMVEGVSLKNVYDELKFIREHMVSKEDFNSVIETFEILNNPETMKQIKASEKDIKSGRTKVVRSVKDILEK